MASCPAISTTIGQAIFWPRRLEAARRKLTGDDIEATKALLANPDNRRHPDCAPPRRFSRNALSVHPGRANREYAGRLREGARA